jgi:hypothetical protein
MRRDERGERGNYLANSLGEYKKIQKEPTPHGTTSDTHSFI